MKMVIHCLIVAIAFANTASWLRAQEETPTRLLVVDYMKVKWENRDNYIDLESNQWKAIHAERVKAGNILRWGVYRVHFPKGSNAAYTHATVTAFDDFDKINERIPDLVKNTLKLNDRSLQQFLDKTIAARTMVKSEIWRYEAGIEPTGPFQFIRVNYMKVPPGDLQTFTNHRMNFIKPLFQEAVNAGKLRGWGLYSLRYPSGTSIPYTHSTVDMYGKFGDIDEPFGDEVLNAAFPGRDEEFWDSMRKRTYQTREMFSFQIWELVDFVDADSLNEME